MLAGHIEALLFVSCAFVCGLADEWGYAGKHGPSHWYEDAPVCNHDLQSPVDIVTVRTLPDPALTLFQFDGYEQNLSGGEFQNNGHSAQLNFPSGKTFRLSGGGMGSNTYTALQLHFHWAAPGSSDGSEHTVNGKHYPVEMHIVHIKDPYKSTGEIKDMADGLAVLGVFLSVEDGPDNAAYQKLFDAVKSCTYDDDKMKLADGPALISLLPASESFYRYSGSLTTPPCYEAVTWTVFQEPVVISRAQLEILQSLKSTENPAKSGSKAGCNDPDCSHEHKRSVDESEEEEDENLTLGGNFRPAQPLNGRIVTYFLDIAFHKTKEEAHWAYFGHSGALHWSDKYPVCAQQKQSPINVNAEHTEALGDKTEDLKPLAFTGYGDPLSGDFFNNGHSVQLDFADSLHYAVSEGGLEESYQALQLHFHWGEVAANGQIESGSEHTLNGKRYPAEMHIVHGKASYISRFSDFLKNSSDAATVLGVFVDVYQHDEDEPADNDKGMNSNMQQLIEAIEIVKFTGKKTDFSAGPPLASLLPDSKSFYRYGGSLTTPPCYEAVVWTLFSSPIVISMNQFIAFQRLFNVEEDAVIERHSIEMVNAEDKVETRVSTEKEKESATLPEDEPAPSIESNETSVHFKSVVHPSADHDVESNETGDFLLRNNYRSLQPLNGRNVYFYESSDPEGEPAPASGLPVVEIVLCTIAGIVIFIIMVAIGMRCCCKKGRKKTQYAAGKRADEEVINM